MSLPLQYPGRAKYNLTDNGDGTYTAPAAPQLKAVDDLLLTETGARLFFEADGVTPRIFNLSEITGGNLADIVFCNATDFQLAIYSEKQVDPTLGKIKKTFRIS